MKSIFKYNLTERISGEVIIKVPKGSKFLKLLKLNNAICAYYEVFVDECGTELNEYMICLTGQIFDSKGYNYVDTFELNGEVLHFYVLND